MCAVRSSQAAKEEMLVGSSMEVEMRFESVG